MPDVMNSVVVTGGSSGLGAAICARLDSHNLTTPINIDIKPGLYEWGKHLEEPERSGSWVRCNVSAAEEVHKAASLIKRAVGPCELLINCAGINEIDYLEHMTLTSWDRIIDVNARAIFLTARSFLPQLIETKGTILNIVSNASHMPMTASLAYNASKGAAHIMTLQLARELTKRYDITVFGISPNKLKGTGMSKKIEEETCRVRGWTPEFAAEYQRHALLCGEETDPFELAALIGYLVSTRQRHKYLTGCIIPYGA